MEFSNYTKVGILTFVFDKQMVNRLHNFELMKNFEEWLQFAQSARLGQGSIRGRKCRLSTDTPDYQLDWADA